MLNFLGRSLCCCNCCRNSSNTTTSRIQLSPNYSEPVIDSNGEIILNSITTLSSTNLNDLPKYEDLNGGGGLNPDNNIDTLEKKQTSSLNRPPPDYEKINFDKA